MYRYCTCAQRFIDVWLPDRYTLRRLRGPILIGLNRFAPVEVCGPRVHEAVLAIWKRAVYKPIKSEYGP
jgi:hypothetical protein